MAELDLKSPIFWLARSLNVRNIYEEINMVHEKTTQVIDGSIFIVALVALYKGASYFFATNGFVQGSEFGMQITIVIELALILIMLGLVYLKQSLEAVLKVIFTFKKS